MWLEAGLLEAGEVEEFAFDREELEDPRLDAERLEELALDTEDEALALCGEEAELLLLLLLPWPELAQPERTKTTKLIRTTNAAANPFISVVLFLA